MRFSSPITSRALPRWVVWSGAAVGMFAIGGIDYASGAELRIFPLYLAPVSFVAWYRGRSSALAAAALCAGAWLGANLMAGLRFSHPAILVANTFVQGVSFAIVGYLIATLRVALVQERGLSRTDPLTALLNQRAFHEDAAGILARCRRAGHPITVAYIDLDDFKTVNDTLGHETGNAVLLTTAGQLRRAVRPSDVVARIGGDEFALLLPEVGPSAAALTLERLRSSLAVVDPSGRNAVTVSIGGVTFTTPPDDVAEMLARADSAMYEAKASGKNRVHVEVDETAAGAPASC